MMKIDFNNLKWIREPHKYRITENEIEIVTEPHTDLWQRTYYHFRNDNAPVLQMETDNWLKGSIEYENKDFQHLGSVVTNHGYSDWATTEISADVKKMWYRLSRREDDYCIECSADGIKFSQMRVCHLHEGGDKIRFGVYACSPEESSFKAIFKNMQMMECRWLAHDGQQPD